MLIAFNLKKQLNFIIFNTISYRLFYLTSPSSIISSIFLFNFSSISILFVSDRTSDNTTSGDLNKNKFTKSTLHKKVLCTCLRIFDEFAEDV